jgi:hypothetical protein
VSGSDSIWWADLPWWERKVLPLGFVTLSFRQLATMVTAFLTAFLVSLPFTLAIAGVSFGSRAAAFCGVFGVGYVVSNRRVKLIPVELQGLYFLRTDGIRKVGRGLRLTGLGKLENGSPPESWQSPMTQEITVDDFKNPVPLVVSDRVEGVQREILALLLVDDKPREQDLVSPEKPRYRLVYVPVAEDLGSRRLEVKLEGSAQSLLSIDLLLKGRTPEVSDSITKVN